MADVSIIKGTKLEQWLRGSKGHNIEDRGSYYHVTIYFSEGGHVSGDIGKDGSVSNIHGTLYAYEADGRRAGGEKIIIK